MVRRLDGSAFPGDPRSVLVDTLEQAQSLGYDYRVSMELEYYLINEDPATIGQPIKSPLSASAAGRYFDAADDRPAQVRDEIVTTLSAIGIKVGGAHHETGPGQEEIDFLEMGALEMADQLITAREVIRSVARRHGFRATFCELALQRERVLQPVRKMYLVHEEGHIPGLTWIQDGGIGH